MRCQIFVRVRGRQFYVRRSDASLGLKVRIENAVFSARKADAIRSALTNPFTFSRSGGPFRTRGWSKFGPSQKIAIR
jgi:hypothetical protein